MPKLTGPLFSVEAHGALAKALTYQRRPGGASVYGYKKPKVPLTDRQIWQRDLIKWCVYEWQQLTDEQKADWEDKAKGRGQSGYSYFLHQRRGYLFDPDVGIYLPLYDIRFEVSPFLSFDSYGHLCTVYGALWTSQGRDFDGEDDYISLPITSPLDLSSASDWSILLWVKASLPTAGKVGIIFQSSTATTRGIFLQLDDTGLVRFAMRSVTAYVPLFGSNITTGWYLLGGTYLSSSNIMAFYENGELKGSGTGVNDVPVPNQNAIGKGDRAYSGTPQYLEGIVGSLLIYNRELSVAEIQSIYLATKWRYS